MTDVATRYAVRDGVCWLTICRPERRNCLSSDVRAGLWEGVRRFNADTDAAVLVITGEGKDAFCAGGDLKEMSEGGLQVPPPDFIPHFGRNVEVSKPTIAAVNGVAYAGGFLLAQMCDLVVAADDAKFAITEVKVGRGAPWSVPLPWLVPPRIAMELLLTGDSIDAIRAREVGLVNHVVPSAELGEYTQTFAESIAANAPLSVKAAKATAYLAMASIHDSALARADTLWRPVYESADAQEGPRAFKEKRSPKWTGN